MNRTPRPLGVRAVSMLTAALSLSLFLAACVELNLPLPSAAPVETQAEQSTADLAHEAEGFWNAGNFPLSELLYSRLLERADLDADGRMQALDRLAVSALRSRHYYQAKQALDRRAAADNSVLTTWAWHDLYLKTLAALDRPELLETHQAWLKAHTELPFQIRARAAMVFAEIYGRGGDFARAVNTLADAHRQAPNRAAKAAFEAEYAGRLRDLPGDQVQGLLRVVGSSGANLFPHALIQREAIRRGQSAHLKRPALVPALAAAPAREVLLAQNAKTSRSDQPAALTLPAPANGPARVALVLPLTGRFATTGQKVLRGASAAQARLSAQGRTVEIQAINSEAPDWREQLAALPASYTVVGGPLLNAEALRALETSGTFAKRAVFAFQPDLGTIQEGRQAWRLFPSFKDQVRALIDLTADKLEIRSVAVLAPKNRYGQRMAEVFQAEAKARGLRLAASESYIPDDHPHWLQSVSRLLKIPEGFRRNKNMPLPMPDFGAVFMPEDWSQAELLASNFYFFEGQHLLFLGTDLWSVGLDNAREVDDTYFQQAACPGAWWPETEGARALQNLLNDQTLGQADFWVALGYDFVRLATKLALPVDWTPAQVNAGLSTMKGLEFSMAPTTWDAGGQARQSLYLFTPRKEGKALVDPDELRQSIAHAKERREKRLVHSRELQKAKKDGPSGSLSKDPQ